jgi:antirestriction protein
MNHEQLTPHEPDREPADELYDQQTVSAPTKLVGDTHDAELSDDEPPSDERLPAEDRPRIWVGSWLDYNNGVLHGQWLDADRDADDIWSDIGAMLAASPTAAQSGDVAEEWGIFDHENFGDAAVGEQDSIDRLSAIARGITQHGPAFAAWAELTDLGPDTTDNQFRDAYLGEFDSVEAYADQLLDDLGYRDLLDQALPEHVRRYVDINVAGLARDMWLSGEISVCHKRGGGVWIFDGRA